MMQLGKHYKEFLTPEKIDAILDDCRKSVKN
jgi:NADH-quinone oxidoreductase subunit E